MPADEKPVTITFQKNEPATSKAVPIATVRSSKLAAMAANINKFEEAETDVESLMEDDASDNDATLVKLQDMLTIPEVIDNDKMLDMENKTNNSELSKMDKEFNQFNDEKWKDSVDEWCNVNQAPKKREKDNCDRASTSSSKDLLLSCVNSSGVPETNNRASTSSSKDLSLTCISPGVSETNYRLGPM